ncbi:16870_t:CDS:2 [Cetraspora pellucida]|uniref:16870_t:CDS:1 n=1 Tax=Cetraspora pellucida TaxID=1433469 RepID=A0A9N8ZKS6_9GLOM|nr:16870_t:CDS:2 [Cetraspora pellucida]
MNYGECACLALVNDEIRKQLPNNITNDTLKKRKKRSGKIYDLFVSIGKEKISGIRLFTASNISNLNQKNIDYIIIEVLKKEVKSYKKTEDFIRFLRNQDLELDNNDFKILEKQKITGWCFLMLNVDKLIQDGLQREPAEEIAEFINKIKGEEQAGSGVVEFWKKLLDVRIIFLIPQDMKRVELNALDSYFTIKDNQICLDKGVIIDSDGILYKNRECTDVQLPSILIDSFGGMLCLPDGVFFLGDKDNGSRLLIQNCYLQLIELIKKKRRRDGPASTGCMITGTPGIGKTYFGLYLLFYIRYNYPKAIIVWQYSENICYQFSPDGDVQEGDISLFRRTLKNPNNFLLIDAQDLTFKYKAYMILLISPKEIITLWDLQYKNKKNDEGEEFTLELVRELLDKWGPIPQSVLLKWDDKTYQKKYDNLISKSDLEKCVNSIDKSGMPTDTISGRLVHLDVNSNFTEFVYRFASSRVSDLMIQAYKTKTKIDVRNFVTSSHEHPMITGFRDNLFEDYAHLELQRGSSDELSRDDKNEDSSKKEIDMKKWKTKKSDAMLEDDKIGEASGSNMGSGQHNLKRSHDAVLVEDESGETSKKGNKKDMKKRKIK